METFEISLFNLKENLTAQYWSHRNDFDNKLKGFSGFNKICSYQSIDTHLELLDFSQWNSLKEAQEANEIVRSEEFKNNLEPLGCVNLFEYGHLLFDFRSSIKESSTTLVELYVYETSEEKVDYLQKQRRIFFEYLQSNHPGFVGIKGFQSFLNPLKQLDLFFLNKTNNLEKINKNIESSEPFKNFVESIDRIELFKTFKSINN